MKSDRPRRILHIISDLSVGGAEIVLCNLLGELDRSRWQPSVISLMNRGPLRERLAALEIPVYSPEMRPGLPSPAAWWRFLRQVSMLQPEVVQGWMYHSNLAASVARRFLGLRAPVVWSIHYTLTTLANERRLTALVIRLGAALSRGAQGVIFVSRTSQQQHAVLGYDISRSVVFPNGINVSEFQPSADARLGVRAELGLAEDTTLIGNIGRFHPMKDQANFLRAAALILLSHPNAQFLLAGREVDRQNVALSELIAKLGIAHRVHLLGERQDIPRLAAALDVFVSASAFGESFPNIIGEAMACGVPCVVTEVGDCGWIVGETGFVVPPQDPQALASGCLAALELPATARQAARARVCRNFALQSVAAHYEELYQSLCENRIN